MSYNEDELLTELVNGISHEDLNEVKDALKKGANVNGLRDEEFGGMSPLMEAVMLPETFEIAKYLVTEAKADVNQLTAEADLCPLALAISSENMPAMKFLVESGAKLTVGKFDAVIAASTQPEALKYILSKGGHVNARDPEFGKTPALMASLACKDLECLKILKEANADFFTSDKLGKNIFHLCATNDNEGGDILKYIVELGIFDVAGAAEKVKALVNARDKSPGGFVPLHDAASMSNVDVLTLLVNHFKADTSIKTIACDATDDRELSCADILNETQESYEGGDEDEEDEEAEQVLEDVAACKKILGLTTK